ncbi:MAG TPA: malonyl-CoA decarboxylase family protein [Acidimicrobiales bacterium]|nr:malonyl-CoA decarboxylase family protein [Acidimicrobiales bacterium]
MVGERAKGRFAESFSRLRRRAHLGRRDPYELHLDPSLRPRDVERIGVALDSVLAQREPVTRRLMASAVLSAYDKLNDTGRVRFFERMSEQLAPDVAAVDAAIETVRTSRTPNDRVAAERELRRVLTPSYARLFHVLTGLPEGVKLLIDLRADLLACRGDDPSLRRLDDELAGHLSTVFDVGLLELQLITWERSPAALLEKLIAYEAVHEIGSWDDLKYRLEGAQRCFAFIHPAMPDEPLIFVEVALTRGIAGNLPVLLGHAEGETGTAEGDTAIFYSITSCQPGLAGIQLGNELIKHVVERLRRDEPGLRNFATLSPIPDFRPWVERQLAGGDVTPGERAAFQDDLGSVRKLVNAQQVQHAPDGIRVGLLSMCARFLTEQGQTRSADSVANFHLSNGARIERLNWLANPAPYEIDRSFGIMANYRYDLGTIAVNVNEYLQSGTIDAASGVRELVR